MSLRGDSLRWYQSSSILCADELIWHPVYTISNNSNNAESVDGSRGIEWRVNHGPLMHYIKHPWVKPQHSLINYTRLMLILRLWCGSIVHCIPFFNAKRIRQRSHNAIVDYRRRPRHRHEMILRNISESTEASNYSNYKLSHHLDIYTFRLEMTLPVTPDRWQIVMRLWFDPPQKKNDDWRV